MDESLCPYRTHGQKNKWKYFYRLSRTRMVLNRCFGQMWLAFFCLCFASPQTHHHHFLQSWLIPDGSCSSGRACWPCVAHQSWVFFFYAAFNFISTRVRGEIFFFFVREPARGCDASGPHVVDEHHLQKPLRRRLRDVARLKSHGYKLPSTTVPGPRLVGVSRLLEPWSSLLCIAFPFVRTEPCLSHFTHSYLPDQTGKIQSAMFVCPSSWLRPHLDVSFFANPRNIIITSWRITKWFQMQMISVHPIPGLLNYSVDESTWRVARMQNVCLSGVEIC